MSRERILPTRGRAVPTGYCRWCKGPIRNSRRLTFCCEECVHHHKLRSNPNYLRRCVLRRDKGICKQCGLDAHTLRSQLMRRVRKEGIVSVYDWSVAHGFTGCVSLSRRRVFKLWQADHIRPVAQGGGLCGLENIQTLCVPCHRARTAKQATARATTRKNY